MCAAAVFKEPGKRFGTHVYCCGDGYSYHVKKREVNDHGHVTLTLRCKTYWKTHCSGRAYVVEIGDQKRWYDTSPHFINCVRDHGSHQERLLRFEIIDACRNGPYVRPRLLLDQISTRYPVHIAARLRLVRIRHAMRRARMERLPNPPNTLENLGDILADEEFSHLSATADELDSMYRATVGGPGTKCVIFMSRRMRRFFGTVKIVFVDGTFDSVPALPAAMQVYQIVTLLRNTVIPIAQILMESRTFEAYMSVLHYIQETCPEFRPEQALMDYEPGQCRAWATAYPECIISGCYVHNIRASDRKMGNLGLKRDGVNPLTKSILRCSHALPLLPPNLIRRGFGVLVNLAQRQGVFDELLEFFHYYMKTWLTGWRYEVLSVFDQQHRTNNACESAQQMLRLATGPIHPNIWTFLAKAPFLRHYPYRVKGFELLLAQLMSSYTMKILVIVLLLSVRDTEGLRLYEQHSFTDVVASSRGLTFGRGRRDSALANDEAIVNFTADLMSGTISLKRFLKRASRRVETLLLQR